MANLLKQLELEELSLVDRPANAQAMVSLYKRDNPNEGNTMSEPTTKMSDDMKMKLKPYMDKGMSEAEAMKAYEDSMKKSLEDEVAKLKAENERLRKAFLDEGYSIEADKVTKAAPVEYVEYDGEQINKADIPAPILKALEAAEVEKADAALTKRAEATLPHFDVAAAKGLLKAVEKMDDTDILIAALEAADKAFADKMEEFGKSSTKGDFASPKDELDALVKEYKEEHNVDFHKAYAEVAKTEAGKALINKSYKDKE